MPQLRQGQLKSTHLVTCYGFITHVYFLNFAWSLIIFWHYFSAANNYLSFHETGQSFAHLILHFIGGRGRGGLHSRVLHLAAHGLHGVGHPACATSGCGSKRKQDKIEEVCLLGSNVYCISVPGRGAAKLEKLNVSSVLVQYSRGAFFN